MSTVVLLPGLGCDTRIWWRLAPLLADEHDVVALDLPGHGERRLPLGLPPTIAALALWVEEDLRERGLDRAHLVGNSLGGWVALELARQGVAVSVTALAPGGLWGPGSSPWTTRTLLRSSRALARATAPLAPLLARSSLVRRVAFWHGVRRPELLTPAEAVALADAMASAEGFGPVLTATRGAHLDAADLPTTVPVTVVFGDRDRLLPARSAQLRHGLPRHARWEVLPGVGHAPMVDAPEQVARLVRETVAVAAVEPPEPQVDLSAYGFGDLPAQTRDDAGGWASNDDRLTADRPPHWG